MAKQRSIGFHLRLETTIVEVARQAQELGLSTFQCFLVHQATKTSVQPTDQEIYAFSQLARNFSPLVLHGAYWINVSTSRSKNAQRMLHKELFFAQELGFSHYVLHAGAALGWKSKEDAIKTLAEKLDEAIEKYPTVKLVLENAAHGGMTIGGNLQDFKLLKQHMKHAQKLYFCIDTAHAYVYGYHIETESGQEEFIKLVEENIDLKNVALLHINDTKEQFASKKDRHDIPGHGVLGKQILKKFAWLPQLQHLPIIFELPVGGLRYARELISYF